MVRQAFCEGVPKVIRVKIEGLYCWCYQVFFIKSQFYKNASGCGWIRLSTTQLALASSYTIQAPVYFAYVIKFVHLILDQTPILCKHSPCTFCYRDKLIQNQYYGVHFDCKRMKHIQLQARNDEFNHPNREREHDVEKGKISNPSYFG